MDAAALEQFLTEHPDDLQVRVRPEAGEHPHLPGKPLPAIFGDARDPALVLYAGSFPAEEAEARSLAHRALRIADERMDEDANAEGAMPLDRSIFEAHADFLADQPVPIGWYRRGDGLGRGLWAVDLDVFLEVVLPEAAWTALRGMTVPLHVQGEEFEIDIPADASLEDCWTLPGCGLFESETGVTIESLDEEEEVPGRFGDLHVIPIAF
jgi:hypothetical protein